MFRRLLILPVICLILFPAAVCLSETTTATDNDKVIALSKKGLDDDIVIARIKASSWKFAVDDDNLVALKKEGVSSKVVAAMLDASVLTTAQVAVDGKPTDLHTLGQAKVGGRLGAAFTYGMKSVKQKAFLPGPKAPVVADSRTPTITIALPKGDTIDSYILVQLDPKDDRRELEVGSTGGIVGGKTGIRAEAIRKVNVTPDGNSFKMVPAEQLKAGEYIVYVVGSADKLKEIYGRGYDFSIN
jgi:hypothetical protein